MSVVACNKKIFNRNSTDTPFLGFRWGEGVSDPDIIGYRNPLRRGVGSKQAGWKRIVSFYRYPRHPFEQTFFLPPNLKGIRQGFDGLFLARAELNATKIELNATEIKSNATEIKSNVIGTPLKIYQLTRRERNKPAFSEAF